VNQFSIPRIAVQVQLLTLLWLTVELAVAGSSAATAHSPALLAFASDSCVEFLSACVVLLQWTPRARVSERSATRIAAVLLFALATVVAGTALVSFLLKLRPEASVAGLVITAAALVIMPLLAKAKRRMARNLQNAALEADSTQSATCAYLALITLIGVGINTTLHVAWFDSLAALCAVPLLVLEGRSAWKGIACHCC
jgi:divalent metal cation (Fe/Co/Zn/Cd) transporter